MIKRWMFCFALTVLYIFGVIPGKALFPYPDSELKALLEENKKESRLIQYKDNESSLKIKLRILDVINENRIKYKRKPVRLDIFASRVANMTASEAARHRYHGHLNLRGEKPYHRYAFSGGLDHIAENAYSTWVPASEKGNDTIFKYCKLKHLSVFSKKSPDRMNRKNILNRWNTHVGLGYALNKGHFRYYEEFVSKFLEFDPVKSRVKAGDTVKISGKVGVQGYGIFYYAVYYEPFPKAKTVSQIKPFRSYPDYTKWKVESRAYWEISYDNNSKRFDISFKTGKKGLYYLHIFIKEGQTGTEKPRSLTTRGLSPVSGIVIKAD